MAVRGAHGVSKSQGGRIQAAMNGGAHALQDNRMLRMRQPETATSDADRRQLIGEFGSHMGPGSQSGAKVGISKG